MPVRLRIAAAAAFGLAMLCSVGSAAIAGTPVFETIYSFSGPDGSAPTGDLVYKWGYLYGTTNSLGPNYSPNGAGTVFQLRPGTGKLTTLWSFTGGTDGAGPWAGVAIKSGAIYGTTMIASDTVFKLTRSATAPTGWAQTTLHTFPISQFGAESPTAPVVVGPYGALYGTTRFGTNGQGSVYKVNPGNGNFTTLHTFSGGADGGNPEAGLAVDPSGALYGTTPSGGMVGGVSKNCGTVFRVAVGTHKLKTLYSFGVAQDGSDGCTPVGGVVLDANGMVYGTTTGAAGNGNGTVFKLDPVSGTLTTLYTFLASGTNGSYPTGKLTFGPHGFLYGTTYEGGTVSGTTPGAGQGTVFQLDPSTGALTTLHVFTGGKDGGSPWAGLTYDGTSTLYGTTQGGGIQNGYGFNGTVFKIIP